MKAGYTKIAIAIWFSAVGAYIAGAGDWKVALFVLTFMASTACLAYQAGRGDDAWK